MNNQKSKTEVQPTIQVQQIVSLAEYFDAHAKVARQREERNAKSQEYGAALCAKKMADNFEFVAKKIRELISQG